MVTATAAVLLLPLLLSSRTYGSDVPAPQPVVAIWKQHKLSFIFSSKQSSYACEAIGDKVWRTLFMLGAREDMHIAVRGCDNNDPLRGATAGGLRATSPVSLRIDVAMPYELFPVDREGAVGERARRELIERVTGERIENPELITQFPAIWEHALMSDFDHLAPGDCELVQQMQKQLFTKLGIRVIEDRISCLPGRQFRGEGRFVVESLKQARYTK